MNRKKQSKTRNRNAKNSKSNPRKQNFQITNKSHENRLEDSFYRTVTNNVIESSPRPITLSERWTNYSKIDSYRRCSGSECEDFKTPSSEYDIRTDNLCDHGYDDFSYNYAKEVGEGGGLFEDTKLETNNDNECNIIKYLKSIDRVCEQNDSLCCDNDLSIDPFQEKTIPEIVDIQDGSCHELITIVNNCLKIENDEIIDYLNESSARCFDENDQEKTIPESVDIQDGSCHELIYIVNNCLNIGNEEIIDYLNESSTSCFNENDNFYNISTDENLDDEILAVKFFTLDIVTEQTQTQRQMTLRARTMEDSFIKSVTSITNVTSISDDNSALNVDATRSSITKSKINPFTKCKNFFKKIKKDNKKVKSNGECDKSLKISLESVKTETLTKQKENKKKRNIFKILFKKKPKLKMEPVQIPSDVTKICSNLPKADIEIETINEFNQTLWSLTRLENDGQFQDTVKITKNNDKNIDNIIMFDDLCDLIFQDAIIDTKKIGIQMSDVPFIDDPIVLQMDMLTFYHGETRKMFINNALCLPLASMESSYYSVSDVPYMDDSMINETENSMLFNGESERCRITTTFGVAMASSESLNVAGGDFFY